MPNTVKNTTFPNLFDLIAPHSCRGCGILGNALCGRCKKDLIAHSKNYCPNCKRKNPTGNCHYCKTLPPTYIVSERSELIGSLIHDLKYNSIRSLAKPLAEILNQTIPKIKGQVIIVPLPTISSHIRKRGLDHTYLIAKNLAKLRGKNYKVKQILIRNQNTVQVGANEKTRHAQAKTAYTLKEKQLTNSPEATYLLLDDVWTTGASMTAALNLLRKANVNNIIVSILAVNSLQKPSIKHQQQSKPPKASKNTKN